MSLGFSEESIAVYTAKEPNDDLMAVARDEAKEVLIFKMAVALGFDASRSFWSQCAVLRIRTSALR